MPFSYIYFEIKSNDGNVHDVQLYLHMPIGAFRYPVALPLPRTEIPPQGEFLPSDSNPNITWTTASTGESVYEMVQLQNQQLYSENSDGQPEWGQYYFATGAVRRFDES